MIIKLIDVPLVDIFYIISSQFDQKVRVDNFRYPNGKRMTSSTLQIFYTGLVI